MDHIPMAVAVVLAKELERIDLDLARNPDDCLRLRCGCILMVNKCLSVLVAVVEHRQGTEEVEIVDSGTTVCWSPLVCHTRL